MKKERGCARNHWMRGGGTATFTSPAGMVQPGFYPEIKVIDSCSVARPGMAQVTPKGLMGGGGRRRRSRRLRKMRGGTYKMDLTGQGMQPNQFAEVVKKATSTANKLNKLTLATEKELNLDLISQELV
jgi:hypothetical protein